MRTTSASGLAAARGHAADCGPRMIEATPAYVLAVDRGRFTCEVDGREVTAVRARELGRKSVVVGDHVGLVGDVSGRHRHAGPADPHRATDVGAASQR